MCRWIWTHWKVHWHLLNLCTSIYPFEKWEAYLRIQYSQLFQACPQWVPKLLYLLDERPELFLEPNPKVYPQQQSHLSNISLIPNDHKLHQDFCFFVKYLSLQYCILLKICWLPLHLIFSFQLIMFYILILMLRTKIH